MLLVKLMTPGERGEKMIGNVFGTISDKAVILHKHTSMSICRGRSFKGKLLLSSVRHSVMYNWSEIKDRCDYTYCTLSYFMFKEAVCLIIG